MTKNSSMLTKISTGPASTSLGLMYYKGRGLPQDYAEAIKWYRLAADQGDAAAQGMLGVMYVHGEGVPQDYVQAHMWLNLAASRYPASGKVARDDAVKVRDQIASKMTPEQIAEAQKLAREWKPKPER
jgi:TPR repeat protein